MAAHIAPEVFEGNSMKTPLEPMLRPPGETKERASG